MEKFVYDPKEVDSLENENYLSYLCYERMFLEANYCVDCGQHSCVDR